MSPEMIVLFAFQFAFFSMLFAMLLYLRGIRKRIEERINKQDDDLRASMTALQNQQSALGVAAVDTWQVLLDIRSRLTALVHVMDEYQLLSESRTHAVAKEEYDAFLKRWLNDHGAK